MKNRVVGNQTMCNVGNQRRTIWRAGSQRRSCDYNSTSDLEMKNRVVGASVGSQCRAILRTGSQRRGCNSTSDLEMKNRVVGASVGRQRRVMLRPLSHRRVRGCNYTSNLDSLRCVGL